MRQRTSFTSRTSRIRSFVRAAWAYEAAVSRLGKNLCKVERRVKETVRSCVHGDATQALEPTLTRREPARTPGYQSSRSQPVLPGAEFAQGVDAVSKRTKDPLMPAPALLSLG